MSLTDSKTENTRTHKKRGPKPQRVQKQAPTFTAEQIEAIADDLLVWCKTEGNQILEAFYKKHGISRVTWGEWRAKNEYVQYVHDVAKDALASNIYSGTPECPSRGIFALKTQHGWNEIEDIMDKVDKVSSFQELKARLKDEA